MVAGFGLGTAIHCNTMPKSGARCEQPQLRPPAYYQMLQKLARGLYRFQRNNSYAEQAARRALSDGPHCLRDCLLVDPAAPRSNETAGFGLLTYVRGGTLAAVKRMSSAWLLARLLMLGASRPALT